MKLRTPGDPFTASTSKLHVGPPPRVGFRPYILTVFTSADPVSLIHSIHARNMKAGVAISPDTPSTAISDDVGEFADMLLVMTVYPGKSSHLSLAFGQEQFAGRGGQKFIERCVPKVAELRARFPDKDIEVDGGVGPKTIGACAQAGKSYFVAQLPLSK